MEFPFDFGIVVLSIHCWLLVLYHILHEMLREYLSKTVQSCQRSFMNVVFSQAEK